MNFINLLIKAYWLWKWSEEAARLWKSNTPLGRVYLSCPPLLATIFVSDKAESTQCSLPK